MTSGSSLCRRLCFTDAAISIRMLGSSTEKTESSRASWRSFTWARSDNCVGTARSASSRSRSSSSGPLRTKKAWLALMRSGAMLPTRNLVT